MRASGNQTAARHRGSRTRHGRRLVGPLAIALTLSTHAGCGNDDPINSLSAKIVIDRTVFKFVRGFAVVALHPQSKKGTSVSCADFPGTYHRLDHPDLRRAGGVWLSWSGQQDEARATLEVSPGQPLLIAVEGRAPFAQLEHVVARGCKAPVVAAMEGTPEPVEIDATATVGRPCTDPTQCEPTLGHCLQGEAFPASGYCGVANCTDDTQCPPGAKCINIGSGTACARACESTAGDCETLGGQECLRRIGPGGCHGVCLKGSSGDNC